MISVANESTMQAEEITSECAEVIPWFRRQSSTSQCLDDERHGSRSWIRRLLDSFLKLLDFDEGEERQDIEPGLRIGDGCGCGKKG